MVKKKTKSKKAGRSVASFKKSGDFQAWHCAALDAWEKEMSSDQRAAWLDYASGITVRDLRGGCRSITGFQLFLMANVRLQQDGKPISHGVVYL